MQVLANLFLGTHFIKWAKGGMPENIIFSAANFSVGGNDPGATGFFFGIKEGVISKPYVGNKGVFIFQKNMIVLKFYCN